MKDSNKLAAIVESKVPSMGDAWLSLKYDGQACPGRAPCHELNQPFVWNGLYKKQKKVVGLLRHFVSGIRPPERL